MKNFKVPYKIIIGNCEQIYYLRKVEFKLNVFEIILYKMDYVDKKAAEALGLIKKGDEYYAENNIEKALDFYLECKREINCILSKRISKEQALLALRIGLSYLLTNYIFTREIVKVH